MLNTWLEKKILDYTDVQKLKVDLLKLAIIPKEVAEKSQTLIFDGDGKHLLILSTNNYSNQLQKLLEQLGNKGYSHDVYYVGARGWEHAFKRYSQLELQEQKKRAAQSKKEHAAGGDALTIIKELFEKRMTLRAWDFIMEVVRLAYQSWASDLHFQAEKDGISVNVRIDGVLQHVITITHKDFLQYDAKLKFISGIKINVVQLPQDGRFTFDYTVDGKTRPIDVRLNTMPSLYGDDIVMRFLDMGETVKSFDSLGIRSMHYDIIKKALQEQNGMILVTGPTGSGKTTTLYAMLNHVNDGTKKIITLENPIEYQLPGIQQSQINEDEWYTYEEGLKAVLRHDPDIILVGETRSRQTAETVINAALTWHLVFTTLHTNSAVESVSRLLSMGVKPYLLAPGLRVICAQRLIRKVCPHCASRQDADYASKTEIDDTLQKLRNIDAKLVPERDGKVVAAVGCDQCNNTGYKGRTVAMEILSVTDGIKELIVDEEHDTTKIFAVAREQWFTTMREDAILKVIAGDTTMEEARRV